MSPSIHVSINGEHFAFEHLDQSGRSIKERGGIPSDHILCLDAKRSDEQSGVDELKVIDDCDVVTLKDGQKFLSHTPDVHHGVTVTINKKPYAFHDTHQIGRSLKEPAGIPISDVLFLHRPKEDEVIGDDTKIVLRCGDCFHSSPPANYCYVPR